MWGRVPHVSEGRCGGMRLGYLLWVAVAVMWGVLAVLSDGPQMRWGFTAAAVFALIAAILGWVEQRQRSADKLGDRKGP